MCNSGGCCRTRYPTKRKKIVALLQQRCSSQSLTIGSSNSRHTGNLHWCRRGDTFTFRNWWRNLRIQIKLSWMTNTNIRVRTLDWLECGRRKCERCCFLFVTNKQYSFWVLNISLSPQYEKGDKLDKEVEFYIYYCILIEKQKGSKLTRMLMLSVKTTPSSVINTRIVPATYAAHLNQNQEWICMTSYDFYRVKQRIFLTFGMGPERNILWPYHRILVCHHP